VVLVELNIAIFMSDETQSFTVQKKDYDDNPPTDKESKNLDKIKKKLQSYFSFDFEYDGHIFNSQIDLESVEIHDGEVSITLVVQADKLPTDFVRALGKIKLVDNEIVYTSNFIQNLSQRDSLTFNRDLPVVKGLVGAYIRELVLKDKIHRWISDSSRTQSANKMYNRLAEDHLLEVKQIQSKNSYHFVIRKRK
jgi:hypothetical protein